MEHVDLGVVEQRAVRAARATRALPDTLKSPGMDEMVRGARHSPVDRDSKMMMASCDQRTYGSRYAGYRTT